MSCKPPVVSIVALLSLLERQEERRATDSLHANKTPQNFHFAVLLQDKHAFPAALLDVYPSPCRFGPFAPWLLLVSAPVATPRKAAAEHWTAPDFHQCCLPNPLLGL